MYGKGKKETYVHDILLLFYTSLHLHNMAPRMVVVISSDVT